MKIAAFIITVGVAQVAQAQCNLPLPPMGGGVPNGGAVAPERQLIGALHELDESKDKFLAWRLATIQGADFFPKEEDKLRAKYQRIYRDIQANVIEERITYREGRYFAMKLIKIGAKGKSQNIQPVKKELGLEELASQLEEARKRKVHAPTLTPRISKLRWLAFEVELFCRAEEEMSQAKLSMVTRKNQSLGKKLFSAKSDGKLDDRERKALKEKALELWEVFVKELG